MHLLDRLDHWTPYGGAWTRWASLLLINAPWSIPATAAATGHGVLAVVSLAVCATFLPYPTFCLAVEAALAARAALRGRRGAR